MNKKGTIALEALIASALSLLLFTVIATQLAVFWQTWRDTTIQSRERQWSVLAFEWLDRDFQRAQKIMVTSTDIRVTIPDGTYTYKLAGNNSFHRSRGTTYYALARPESVRWWREEEHLLWIELIYPKESYKACFNIEGK